MDKQSDGLGEVWGGAINRAMRLGRLESENRAGGRLVRGSRAVGWGRFLGRSTMG